MIQMQLLVATVLPSVFWLGPVGAVIALMLAWRMRGEARDSGGLGRGWLAIGLGLLVVGVARALPSGGSDAANALAIGGAGGSVLAAVALWLIARIAGRGSDSGAVVAGAALGVIGAGVWTWVLTQHGEAMGVADGDLRLVSVALLASCVGSVCAAAGVRGGDAGMARGMDAYATVRCVLCAACAVAVYAAGGMTELADGERRTLALRLVGVVLACGGIGAAAGGLGAGSKGARGSVAAGVVAAVGCLAVAWFSLKGETAISGVSVGLAIGAGIAAAAVMGWRRSAGLAALALAGIAGWRLLASDTSEGPGLLGVALVALGFVSIAGVRRDHGEEEVGSATAGVLLAAGLIIATAAHQTLAGAALGRQYPAANYRNGQFVGRVDIAGPHGVYVGDGLLAMIFPGAGANYATVYDAGMIDRTRLQEHVLETLGPGMIFPLASPGAEDHSHDDHVHHDHSHDGGHDSDPAAARSRVLTMRGEVPHGDHSHAYVQDVIATRHATLADVLAFHGGGALDGRMLAGLLAGAALAVWAGACWGTATALGVVAASAAVLLLAGPGAACGMVLGMAGACVVRAPAGGGGVALKLAAVTAVVLAGAAVRLGAML